jgi:hypothetical protein
MSQNAQLIMNVAVAMALQSSSHPEIKKLHGSKEPFTTCACTGQALCSAVNSAADIEEGAKTWRDDPKKTVEVHERVSEARPQRRSQLQQSPKRRTRTRRPAVNDLLNSSPGTPSSALIAALEATNHRHAIPEAYPNMTDLSFANQESCGECPDPNRVPRYFKERPTSEAPSWRGLQPKHLYKHYWRNTSKR